LAPRKAFNAGEDESKVTASIGPNITELNTANTSKVGRFSVQLGYQPGTAADLAFTAIEVKPPIWVPGIPPRPGRPGIPSRLLPPKLRAVVKNIGPDPLICRAAETLYLTVLASSRKLVEIKTDIIPANQPFAPGAQAEKTEDLIDQTTGKPLAAGTYDLVASVGDPIGCENVNHGNNTERRRITIPALDGVRGIAILMVIPHNTSRLTRDISSRSAPKTIGNITQATPQRYHARAQRCAVLGPVTCSEESRLRAAPRTSASRRTC
jgi:hypothetical protein